MRFALLALATLTFAVLVPSALVPAAEARPICVHELVTCVEVPCVFSVHNEPGCIVRNPCDPRYCDPWWP